MPSNEELLAHAASDLDDAADKLMSVIHSTALSEDEQAAAKRLAADAISLAGRVRALKPATPAAAATRVARAAPPVPPAVDLAKGRVDHGIADLEAINLDDLPDGGKLQDVITAATTLSTNIATAVGRHAPPTAK